MNAFEPITRLLPAALRRYVTPDRGSTEPMQRLAAILQVDRDELASLRMGPRYHYRPFTIAKPDGRERRILAPSPALKGMQRRLLDGYLGTLPVHPCAMAFRPGASTVKNARAHAHASLVATVDLRDFFESTSAARVRRYFTRNGWHGDALHALMCLCTIRNALPQGAPTSPVLSNLVNSRLDDRLLQLAQNAGSIYTRYGDDLTFSWNTERMPAGFREIVEDRLHDEGYAVQPSKGWRVSPIREQPTVTGLVLRGNGRLAIPWALRWRMWRLRLRVWWTGDADLSQSLEGYKAYARSVW